MFRRTILPVALLAGLLIGVAGCSGGGAINVTTPGAAFTEGKELYDRGRYMRAIEYFQRVFDFGRAHEYAADAQYYLAYSYFNSRQYLLAANEFTRFAEFYRTDPRVEEGEFMRAYSYVRLSPPFQLDQTDTQNALTYLRLYVSKYPEGEYAGRAMNYIEDMRRKLARKQLEIAELYERRDQFHAAAIEYLRLLDEYPESEWADNALFGALRNYKAYAERSIPARRAERFRLAAEQYERLVQLFPQSPLIAEAEPVYREVQAVLQRLEPTAARQ